ncbi:MAG TPA: oligopeptide transporter, OPT family [Nitrospirales bacterium]|jgi:putative OPT family oligopeptide transporter
MTKDKAGSPERSETREVPLIPPESALPEITVKAVLLSIILAGVLAAANAYLGLFAGMTVSASIPAAVVSMAIFRLFRRSNILENNIVQTAASSGEAVAAGVIFTIPALILIGYWSAFDYRQTALISMVGGLLGVLFTIPLRRALIVEARLRYPEGVATAEVLKLGSPALMGADPGISASKADPAEGVKLLLQAALLGGVVKLGESGMRLWSEALEGALRVGRSVFYGGLNLSPALVAVGYIIGFESAVVVFLGGALAAFLLVPLLGVIAGQPETLPPLEAAKALWGSRVRFVGIGAMLIGGLWTLIQLRGTILQGLRRSIGFSAQGVLKWSRSTETVIPRTDRDVPLLWLIVPFLMVLVVMGWLYNQAIGHLGVAVVMTVMMAAMGFLFSAVAGYMAGIVGSSSNPVSGVTIATVALSAILLMLIMGSDQKAGPAAALMIGAVVCCAAAMGGDNLQDLKTGHIVGATPWKQQIMQVVGVATGAVVIAPVLTLLQAKYGLGEITAEHPHPLTAPQATLMANLAQGVFGGSLPWGMVALGALIALLVILWDRRQQQAGTVFRVPVLAFALGLYLPLKLSGAILVGGIVAALVQRKSHAQEGKGSQTGLLCAAGLVTGEALMGIALAIPVALSGVWPGLSPDPLMVFEVAPWNGWPGLVMLSGVTVWLYLNAIRSAKTGRR